MHYYHFYFYNWIDFGFFFENKMFELNVNLIFLGKLHSPVITKNKNKVFNVNELAVVYQIMHYWTKLKYPILQMLNFNRTQNCKCDFDLSKIVYTWKKTLIRSCSELLCKIFASGLDIKIKLIGSFFHLI